METASFKYPIGTTFKPRGKNYEATVVDHLVTHKVSDGTVFSRRYHCQHIFLGCIVNDYDVVEPTIARALGV